MHRNQVNTVLQNDQTKPGAGKDGKDMQTQSISSPESASTPGEQQTAFCDLSTKQKHDFLSEDTSICKFIKDANTPKNLPKTTTSNTKAEFDTNNNQNNNTQNVTKLIDKSTIDSKENEHQSACRSFSLEQQAAQTSITTNLPDKLLLTENLLREQIASGEQTQSNSLPTIQLSSENEQDDVKNAQIEDEKLNYYRKSSDVTHKRSRSAKKSTVRLQILNKEIKLDEINSKVNKPIRTRSFNTSKHIKLKQTNSSSSTTAAITSNSTTKKHHEQSNRIKTSSKSSSIDSNLNIHTTNSPKKSTAIQRQFEKHFDKRARKESRCKHRHHQDVYRKSSARQLIYPSSYQTSAISPQPGLLSYSRSSEDVRTCNCSRSSELAPTVYLLNNGCFSSTSALVADSSNSITGLHLHHSPTAIGTSVLPTTSFLLLPDTTCGRNFTPSPTYLTSYSNVQSYNTTPVHKHHKHRSSSKSTKSSSRKSRASVSPIPPLAIEHLGLNLIENRLIKSNSVRLSRVDSGKIKCTKNHPCKKCRRKTSLNSTIRGQLNYAEYPDNKHITSNVYSSNLNGSTIAQPIHLPTQTITSSTSPLILHNPLHLHPAILHEPLTKSNSLNPAALTGHLVSPLHLCQISNNTLLANELTTASANKNSNNSNNQLDGPSTLSVPDLSRLIGINLQEQQKIPITQSIALQCTHLISNQLPAKNDDEQITEAKVSAALTKLYRDKPAPNYFTNLFSTKESNKLESGKPKLIDYLLTGGDDLDKFLSKSDNLVNETVDLKNLNLKNRRSSSTDSLNIKTTITQQANDKKTSIGNEQQSNKAKMFKEKLFSQLKQQDTDQIDKPIKDDKNNEENSKKEDEETKITNKLLEKRKTSNRNPMLNLLRKAQQTTQADVQPQPLSFKEQSDNLKDEQKDNLKIENENQIDKAKIVNQNSIEQSIIEVPKENIKELKSSLDQNDIIQSEQIDDTTSNIKQPNKRRQFLSRMLASKKETKQIPMMSKSLDQQPVNQTNNLKKKLEYHTVDIPQTQEEIAESTDELHALRTNLQKTNIKNGSSNQSKSSTLSRTASNAFTNILRRNSLSKDENLETTASSSTMAKLRKKATSGLAVRFAKLTHYASVDNGNNSTDNNISTTATTSTKSHVNTISGRLSSLASRSISLDKPNSNAGLSTGLKNEKRSLANFRQSANSTSIASTNISMTANALNRPRYSVTIDNTPKLTDLRKILHPEEERRDLETVCKSFWDSFIEEKKKI